MYRFGNIHFYYPSFYFVHFFVYDMNLFGHPYYRREMSLSDIVIIIFRTFLIYIIILFVLRVMGKREVGELGVIDVVVFIMMAEVGALAIEDTETNLLHAILPIFLLLIIQFVSSVISLKSKKFRDLVDGDPSVIIRNGIILEDEMRKQRYNLDDLFQQLREQQIGSIREVTFAFLEPSGNLSVFTEEETQPVLALISDGVIQNRHIEIVGVTEQQLIEELSKLGIHNIEHVFYCSYESGNFLYQLKEEFQ